jgi:hypothetical protein
VAPTACLMPPEVQAELAKVAGPRELIVLLRLQAGATRPRRQTYKSGNRKIETFEVDADERSYGALYTCIQTPKVKKGKVVGTTDVWVVLCWFDTTISAAVPTASIRVARARLGGSGNGWIESQ